jgi:ApaG protein
MTEDVPQPLIPSTSEAITNGVRVQVSAEYSEAHSTPAQGHWFFLYTIRISNEGDEEVQLMRRHWYITHGTGKLEEVEGEGVVGEQPTLTPGQSFEYTSGCPLESPFGSMYGQYHMVTKNGTEFEAEVALFELRQAASIH